MTQTWRRRLDNQVLRWQARLDSATVDRLAPWIIGAALWLLFALLALARSRELTFGAEMAGPLQVVWLIGEGLKPQSTLLGHDFLWEQAAFLIYPVAGLTKIAPPATSLLVLQAFALALGVVPLWRIARRVAGLKVGGTSAVVFAYAAYSAVHSVNLAGFNVETLALPALLFAVLFGLEHRWLLMGLAVVLVLAARADLGLAVAGLGVLLLLEGSRRAGLVTIVVGLTWAAVAILAIQPLFNNGEFPHVDAFGEFGQDNPFSVLWGIITKPHVFIQQLWSRDNFDTTVLLLAPVLFLPVVAPRYLLPAVPLYALYVVADTPSGQIAEAPQAIPITAFIFVATIFALKRSGRVLVERVNVDRRVIWALVLTATVFFLRDAPSSLYENPWDWGRQDVVDGARLEAVDIVPLDAPVRASAKMLPLVPERTQLYELESSGDPNVAADEAVALVDWIVLDRDAAPEWDDLAVTQFGLRLGWDERYNDQGVLVWQRPPPEEDEDGEDDPADADPTSPAAGS